MTTWNARLLNLPRLREIAEVADSISDACNVLGDALAEYENADDLTGEEKTEAREDARGDAWNQIGEILALAERLAVLRERVEDTSPV